MNWKFGLNQISMLKTSHDLTFAHKILVQALMANWKAAVLVLAQSAHALQVAGPRSLAWTTSLPLDQAIHQQSNNNRESSSMLETVSLTTSCVGDREETLSRFSIATKCACIHNAYIGLYHYVTLCTCIIYTYLNPHVFYMYWYHLLAHLRMGVWE